MEIKNVKNCPWNPRSMSRSAKLALKSSIEEFDDIAGIVIDANTGELICGNHRFDEICSKYGKATLELKQVIGEFHAILSGGKFINYIARIVDWEDWKIKSANITANNTMVTGEFTSKLQEHLAEIADNISENTYNSLKLSDLTIDLSIEDSLSLDLDGDVDYAKKANDLLDNASGEEPEPVREVISVIKVSVPEEIRDRVKNDLLEFLAKRPYYNEINIV